MSSKQLRASNALLKSSMRLFYNSLRCKRVKPMAAWRSVMSRSLSKSPLAVGRTALAVARNALPLYSSPYSRKDFTQHQLFAMLVLRQFFKMDYRGVCVLLGDLRELRELVPVNTVPSFETYCDTAAGRIDLMPDIKDYPPGQRETFIAGLDATLTKYGLLDNALFIGRKEIGKAFIGRARVSTSKSPEQLAASDRARTHPAPTPHPTPNVIPAKAGISRNAGAPIPAEQNQSVPSVQSEAQSVLARNYFVFAHAKDFTGQSTTTSMAPARR